MSNSVDILIKADDQASKPLQNVSNSLDTSASKFQQAGKKAKAATEIVGAFANITGSSELAGFAGMLAGATEKMGGFAESAKNGGTSSLAFKAGLAGLVGTIAFGFGKALADVIWKTAEFEKQLEITGKQAQFLDKSVAELQSRMMSQAREDIELIQDPEQKQAAYKALIDDLNKNIDGVSKQVEKSRKEVLKWADSWQITGDRKQYAKDADEQLQKDMERLEALKRERDEITRNTSERAKNIEAIKAANAAKERSRAYLEDLKREVQYLQASAEERRAMDAMKNATQADQGEAQRLLAERDAILAKQQAEKDLQQQRKQEAEERKRQAEQIKQEKEREKQAIENIKASERERLELLKIEIEQGKEAARIKELTTKGVDEKTAKELVAEQARLEKLQTDKARQDELKKNLASVGAAQKLTASESRLLTRGSSEDQSMVLQRAMTLSLQQIQGYTKIAADAGVVTKDQVIKVAENTGKNVQVVVPK